MIIPCLSPIRIFLLASIVLFSFSCSEDSANVSEEKASKSDARPLYQQLTANNTGIAFNSQGQLLYPGDLTGLYSNVSGVAVGDINNDGLPDLFFSGGRADSKLYLNEGDFKFKDITASSGIKDGGINNADNQGVNMVDVNGDGWLDIYILKTGIKGNFKTQQFTSDGANLLYINQQNNTFIEQGKEYGLDIIGLSHTANFFDYDADGDLDVYIIQTGEPGSTFSFAYYEAPPRSQWLNDLLLENQNGKYVDVREKAGLPYKRNIGLSVSVGDVNNDGYSDIYVANDFFGPDYFYINNGDKTFSDARENYFSKTPMSSMGSDFADINNDGWIDLFVGEMMPATHLRQKMNLVPFSIEIYNKLLEQGNAQYTRNMLQINKQGKKFRDIGLLAGVYATEWSWSSFFMDADNDGLKDLYVANGILRDMTNMDFVKSNFGDDYTNMANPKSKSQADPRQAPSVKTNNYLFKNEGDYRFTDKNSSWGLDQAAHTRGATYADLDADGDLDIIQNNIDGSPFIYQNLSEQVNKNNFLRLRLEGNGKNTYGIGANVSIYYDGQQQSNYLSTQRGFQSGPEPIVHFGLSSHNRIDTLIITWPGGTREAWYDIDANQLLKLKQGTGTSISKQSLPVSTVLQPVANGSTIKHQEKVFQDYKIERLLIRQYSKEGPGTAIADVDGDGTEDLFIGGGAGQSGQLYMESSAGTWQQKKGGNAWENNKLGENMGVVFFDANSDGTPDLYLSSGSNEFLQGAPALEDKIYINDGKGNFSSSLNSLPIKNAYTSVVAASDYDNDGDQDLFIGSRIVPGDYSAIPESYILQNDNGSFKDITASVATDLKNAGRITSAIWTDANGDGSQDLLIAGEWMPLTLFLQEKGSGTFKKRTIPNSTGWWNSVIGADIDNDGDTDYIAGNHGLNNIFKASSKEAVTLLVSDLDQNGNNDPIVFKYTDGVNAPFVNRDIFISQMPFFNNQFYSFENYAKATYNNLTNEEVLANSTISEVQELRSCVFINNGKGEFSMKPLPVEAQLAPLYGILPLDINSDGNIDLLISGNTYSNHYEYGSIDALDGQLLIGNGDGSFKTMPVEKSGFSTNRAGRSLTWLPSSDKNRAWIIATNNNESTQFFRWEFAPSSLVKVPSDKVTHAIITFPSQEQQKVEFYNGGGYLSQSARYAVVPPNASIKFYNHGQLLE